MTNPTIGARIKRTRFGRVDFGTIEAVGCECTLVRIDWDQYTTYRFEDWHQWPENGLEFCELEPEPNEWEGDLELL